MERSGGGPPRSGEGWKVGVLGTAGLVLLGSVITQASAGYPSEPSSAAPDSSLLMALALAGVLVDVLSVSLPGFGFFSPAFALYFALALSPGPGMRLAALACLGGLALRTAFRGHVLGFWRVREAVGDLFPVAAGLAATFYVQRAGIGVALWPLEATLPAVAAGAAAYVFTALTVPGLFVAELSQENAMSWGVVRERLSSQIVGVVAAGVLVAVLARFSPWLVLLVLPLLLALHRAAALGAFWARVEERRRLERRLDHAREQLTEAEGLTLKTRRELAVKVDEYALLESLATSLGACEGLAASAKVVVGLVQRLVPSQTVAVFLAREEGLVPVAFESPHRELLSSLTLLRVKEPVVERAWKEQRPLQARVDEMRGSEAIADERSRLAVPIPGHGVLYVGNRRPDAFLDQHLHMLNIVAGQAALAFQSTGRYEAQQEALRLHAEAHGRLDAWVKQLDGLLAGLRELLASLDPQALLEHLGSILAEVAPHDVRLVLAGERPGEPPGRYRLGTALEVEELVDTVLRNRLPLLLDDVKASRFPPPAPGLRSVLAVPMVTEQGVIGAVVLAARDPGAFQREHQDLAFMLAYQAGAAFWNAHLHSELRETHRQLQESQAQLIQSSKMAAVGQLAAGVAHELNTPLGAVLLGLDSALPNLEKRPERAAARLETARKAVLQAREIVSKLLFYSRDARHGFREISLNEVVEDTLELIGHQLRMDGVEVDLDLGEVPPIVANQSEIQQVLTNLVLNARDAMAEAGSPERRVAVRTSGDGAVALVEVADHGPGMTAEVRDRIFEPFYTTKPVGRGTGLGLSVSLEILRRHHGEVEVDTAPGEGARFRLRLPGLAPSEVAEAEAAALAPSPGRRKPGR